MVNGTPSARELLEFAEMLEENGADFYRTAAGLRIDSRDAAWLLRLARMEEDHKKIFARMRQALSPRPPEQPAADEKLEKTGVYLKALIDSQSLEGSTYARYIFSGQESLAAIILIGIDLEKETILYYLGMQDAMPDENDKKVVDQIIAEEKEHLATLVAEYGAAR